MAVNKISMSINYRKNKSTLASNGLLVYVAQAFLLVGSIFGLDYYVKLITRKLRKEEPTKTD